MIYFSFILITLFFLVALGTKWEIKQKIVLPWALLMAVLGCFSLYFFNRIFPGHSEVFQVFIGFSQACILTGIIFILLFFRDPERIPPTKDRIVLSPADGTVIYVKEINNGEFPFAIKGRNIIPLKEFTGDEFIIDNGFQIGIEMTYVNVHINRSPIPGKVECVKRVSGSFFSLKKVSSLLENERVFTVFNGKEIKVGIVQIASRLVRRIVPFIDEGETVASGQRIGKITFGSQVDVLIPSTENLNITIKPGDDVKAGISIIAMY